MTQTITIDPVTRLEGHGKITIQLNGQGEVKTRISTSRKCVDSSGSQRAAPSTKCRA